VSSQRVGRLAAFHGSGFGLAMPASLLAMSLSSACGISCKLAAPSVCTHTPPRSRAELRFEKGADQSGERLPAATQEASAPQTGLAGAHGSYAAPSIGQRKETR